MEGWAGASCLDGDTRARIKMGLFFLKTSKVVMRFTRS
jgi:hypothetical protein